MRKLESKEEATRRKRRNQIIVGVILVAVMLFSVLGYGFQTQDNGNSGSTNPVNYNGFNFVNNGAGYWILNMGNYQFFFRNTPNDTIDYNVTVPSASVYSGKPLYFFSQNREAEGEIHNNFQNIYLRSQYACLNVSNESSIETSARTDCNPDYPIKTCEDNFIIIEEAQTPQIVVEGGCVFIRAPPETLVETTDEFLFRTLGIK